MLFFACPASAADAEPIRVEVSGSPGCSSNAEFFEAVHARTQHVRSASASDTAGHTLRVRLDRSAGAVKGELTVIDAQGRTTRRELSGETCDVVMSGLVWVAARAVDPQLSLLPPTVQAPVASPALPPPPPPLPPLFPCAPIPAPGPPPPPPPTPAPAPSPSPRWRLAAGAEAYAFGAAPPVPVVDVGVFAELARDSTSTLAPAFRLSVHHTSDAEVVVPEITGSFAWSFVRAEACPWRFDVSVSFELRACGLVDGGVLSASATGSAASHAGSHLEPWFTAGELARLEWSLPGPFRLQVEGGLTVPIVRETFAFGASTTVYEAPAVVGFASLGLGVRFP